MLFSLKLKFNFVTRLKVSSRPACSPLHQTKYLYFFSVSKLDRKAVLYNMSFAMVGYNKHDIDILQTEGLVFLLSEQNYNKVLRTYSNVSLVTMTTIKCTCYIYCALSIMVIVIRNETGDQSSNSE